MNAALREYREALAGCYTETFRGCECGICSAKRERLDRAVKALIVEGIFRDRIETQVLPSGVVVYATPAPLQAASVMGEAKGQTDD